MLPSANKLDISIFFYYYTSNALQPNNVKRPANKDDAFQVFLECVGCAWDGNYLVPKCGSRTTDCNTARMKIILVVKYVSEA